MTNIIVLWEILIPHTDKNGITIEKKLKNQWADRVKSITTGFTILPIVADGYWTNPFGVVLEDKMIPVRVACTKSQIEKIALMTTIYFDQESIMYYSISNEVYIMDRKKLNEN